MQPLCWPTSSSSPILAGFGQYRDCIHPWRHKWALLLDIKATTPTWTCALQPLCSLKFHILLLFAFDLLLIFLYSSTHTVRQPASQALLNFITNKTWNHCLIQNPPSCGSRRWPNELKPQLCFCLRHFVMTMAVK